MSAAGKPAAPDTVVVLRTVDGKRMCKLFRRSTSGQVYRTDYDKAYLYAVELHRCDGIRGAHKLLVRLEPDPHACIIRGAPDETTPRHRTPRQKAKPGNPNGHFLEVPRQLVQLDIDGIPPPPGMDVLSEPEEAAHAIAEMAAGYAPELDGVTVVVQHASSAGVSDLGLR